MLGDAGEAISVPDEVTKGPSSLRQRVAIALVAFAAGIAVLTGTVGGAGYAQSDAVGTLLVSEQIIDNHTIALDAYDPSYLESRYNFYRQDGSYYDFFPLGTSLVVVPAVALLKAAGIDVFERNTGIQLVLSSLIAVVTVLLLYALARLFLPFPTSLILSAVFWFGTTLASTGGTALWSHNLAVVFGLVALILIVRIAERACLVCWAPLGVALFLAYLCRPTMALLALTGLAYVATKSRTQAIKAGCVLGLLFLAFIAFSEAVFDQWLPVYYLPQRLGADRFGEALAGHLVSPSRGLLVFTPMLILIPLFALLSPRQTRERAGLLLLAIGWPILHWLVISRHPQWYGGFSYGPRLLTDVLPGVFLAAVLVWPASFANWPARLLLAVASVLAAFGIYVHSYQGLHNEYTLIWNASPRVEDYPAKVFDWRYPQFLHNEQREQERSELPEYESRPAPA